MATSYSGLYCGGESAGGFSLHGLARCTVRGASPEATLHQRHQGRKNNVEPLEFGWS